MLGISYAAPVPTLAPAAGPSPETIALQQEYARHLLAGSDQPIHSWSQGVAGIVDALVGGTMARKAGERQAAGEASANDAFSKLLMGGQNPAGVPGVTPPQASAPSSPDTSSGGDISGLAALPMTGAAGGAAPAVTPPAAAGAPAAPLVSQAQIAALMRNPFATPAQKAMALELWKAQMPKPPAAPEPYTLKPGEHRFLRGSEIANVPADAPDKWTDLPPTADGSVYQRNDKTGELREGIKGSTPGDKWTDLPPDAQGNVLQRNERTGEVKQAVAGDVKSPAAFNQAKELAVAGRTQINVGSTGIDYGDPEKGYAWKRDANGKVMENANGAPIQVPIGGGSIETAASQTAAGDAATKATKGGYADITTNTIDRILSQVEAHPSQTTGIGGRVEAALGVGYGNDTAQLLSTIKAATTLDTLKELRESAKASGAAGTGLGAVSDAEGKLMQDRVVALDQSQSTEQFKQNLRILKEVYKAIITRGLKADDPILNGVSQPQSAIPDDERAAGIAELKRRGLMK